MVRGIEKIYLITFAIQCMLFLTNNCTELETYLQAKKECQEGNIPQAIALFQSLPHKGDAILYNLGVCYFQIGDLNNARAYWHLALSKATYALFPSITQAISEAGVPCLAPTGLKWYLARLGTLFSIATWQIFVILCLLILLVSLFFYGKKALIALFFLVILLSIYFTKDEMVNYPVLTVQSDTAALQVSPYQELAAIEILQKGTCVKLLQKENQWYKIRHHNKTGWVKKNNLVTDDQ